MSRLTWPRGRNAGRLWLVVMLVGAIGCGPTDQLLHGVRQQADGSGLELSAMMPRCGCITLENLGTGSQTIELVSRLHDADVGSLVLPAGERVRIGYDWAGPSNDDVYQVEGYLMTPNGRGGFTRAELPLAPLSTYVERSGNSDVVCRASDCAFGTLRMDRAMNASAIGGQPASRQSGVEFMNGGQQLWAASAPASCGCMMIMNINPAGKPVIVRSALHSRDLGVLEVGWDSAAPRQPLVLLGFDSAGTEDGDYYLLTTMAIDENGNVGADESVASQMATRAVRAQDYIRIVGQMDSLECSAEGAVVYLPAPPELPPGPGETVSPTQIAVTCPFASLGMREIVQRQAEVAAQPPPAAKRSQK